MLMQSVAGRAMSLGTPTQENPQRLGGLAMAGPEADHKKKQDGKNSSHNGVK
jgi:hypothetical protein